MRDFGRVKFFLADRGLGFVARDDGADFFVHITNVEESTLEKGDRVSFEIAVNERKQKPEAVEVRLTTESGK